MLWTLVRKHLHLRPNSLNSEYMHSSVKYISNLDVNQVSVHEVKRSFKGFSIRSNVSPYANVEAGGHHDGVDQPAGRSGTQMLLFFDDLYSTEGCSGAVVC